MDTLLTGSLQGSRAASAPLINTIADQLFLLSCEDLVCVPARASAERMGFVTQWAVNPLLRNRKNRCCVAQGRAGNSPSDPSSHSKLWGQMRPLRSAVPCSCQALPWCVSVSIQVVLPSDSPEVIVWVWGCSEVRIGN